MLQARMLRPYTEKFFRTAGLAPGMRVRISAAIGVAFVGLGLLVANGTISMHWS